SSWRRSSRVCAPAFQAWSTVDCASERAIAGSASHMKSTPGETMTRSNASASPCASRTCFACGSIAVAVSRTIRTPCRATPEYGTVMSSSVLKPPSTMFEIGHETNASLGSTSVTSIDGSSMRMRSEEHTSELQSHLNLVCRLLLEKKKIHNKHTDQW